MQRALEVLIMVFVAQEAYSTLMGEDGFPILFENGTFGKEEEIFVFSYYGAHQAQYLLDPTEPPEPLKKGTLYERGYRVTFSSIQEMMVGYRIIDWSPGIEIFPYLDNPDYFTLYFSLIGYGSDLPCRLTDVVSNETIPVEEEMYYGDFVCNGPRGGVVKDGVKYEDCRSALLRGFSEDGNMTEETISKIKRLSGKKQFRLQMFNVIGKPTVLGPVHFTFELIGYDPYRKIVHKQNFTRELFIHPRVIPEKNFNVTFDAEECGGETTAHFSIKEIVGHMNSSSFVLTTYSIYNKSHHPIDDFLAIDENVKFVPKKGKIWELEYQFTPYLGGINITFKELLYGPYLEPDLIEFDLIGVKSHYSPKKFSFFFQNIERATNLGVEISTKMAPTCKRSQDFKEFSVVPSSTTQGEKVNLTISFSFSNLVSEYSDIIIVFPEEYKLLPWYEMVRPKKLNNQCKDCIISFSINGQNLTLFFPLISEPQLNITHTFELGTINMLNNTKVSGSFKLVLVDKSTCRAYDKFDLGCRSEEPLEVYVSRGSVTLQSDYNPFKAIAVTPDDNEASMTTEYQIRFIHTGKIAKGGSIKVTFPPEFSLQMPSNFDCSAQHKKDFQNISPDAQCYFNGNRTIEVKNGFSEDVDDKEVVFYISGIQNPESVLQTKSLEISTETPEGYGLNKASTGLSLNIRSKEFVEPKIDFENPQNNDISKLYITVFLRDDHPANCNMMITLPPEVKLISSSCQVYLNDALNEVSQCQVDPTDPQKLTISGVSANAMLSGQKIKFFIPQVQNFRSFKPSSSFKVVSFNSEGEVVNKKAINFSATNKNSGKVDNFKVVPGSKVTGDKTTYDFHFTSSIPLANDDIVEIFIPKDIEVKQSEVSAIGYGDLEESLMIQTITKSDTGSLLKVILKFKENLNNVDTENVIGLKGLINPVSKKPTKGFDLRITDTEGYLIGERAPSSDEISVVMEETTQFRKCELSSVTEKLNQFDELSFSIITKDKVEGDSIIIEYPKEISFNSDSCSITVIDDSVSSEARCSIVKGERRIILTNLFTEGKNDDAIETKFTLSKSMTVLEPNKLQTGEFKVYHVDESNYEKERKEGITLQYKCYYPCDTCADNKPDQCTKCYLNSDAPYLLDSKCFSICPTGYSPNTDNECIKCNEKCSKCDPNNTSKCTKCGENFPYFSEEKFDCLSSLPEGYFADKDSNIKNCSSLCKTCENSPTSCLSCDTSAEAHLLYGDTCVSTCPKNSIEKDGICHACDSSCETCDLEVTLCTSCATGFLLYNSKCIEAASCASEENRFIDLKTNTCLDCNSKCSVCGSSVDNCNECKEGYVLKEGECFLRQTQCEEGKYLLNGLCEECDLKSCKGCAGKSDGCTSCNDGLLLEDSHCVEKCTPGYFESDQSRICEKCSENCGTCSSFDSCLSCNENMMIKDDKCVTREECQAEEGKFLLVKDGVESCEDCVVEGCSKCNEDFCEVCAGSFLLFNNACVESCPEGYVEEENTKTCIMNVIVEKSFIYNLKYKAFYRNPLDYYTIPVIPAVFIIALSYIKLNNKEMLYLPLFISVLAIMFKITLVLQFSYIFHTGMIEYFALLSCIIFIHSIINFVYILLTVFYCLSDSEFYKWKMSNKPGYALCLGMMFIFDYKCMSCIYSRITRSPFFNLKADVYQRIYSPLKIIEGIDLVLVQLSSVVFSFLMIIQAKTFSTLFYLSCYSAIFSCLIFISMIVTMIIFPHIQTEVENVPASKEEKEEKPEIKLDIGESAEKDLMKRNQSGSDNSRKDALSTNRELNTSTQSPVKKRPLENLLSPSEKFNSNEKTPPKDQDISRDKDSVHPFESNAKDSNLERIEEENRNITKKHHEFLEAKKKILGKTIKRRRILPKVTEKGTSNY